MLNKEANQLPPIEILYWKDVRQEVKNAELVRIIDNLDPGKKLRFLRLQYSYGSTIVHEGNIQIPIERDKCVPLQDPLVPSYVKELLNYSTIPLGLLLNKASEIFIETNQRIIPLNILKPGYLFGLFETLSILSNSPEPTPVWSVFAGARSAFMLPKITDALSHRRLRLEFGLPSDPPKSPLEHCSIFSAINQCQPPERRWHSNVLLFSSDWFKNDFRDPAWLSFQNYLFKLGWSHTKFKFDNVGQQILWEALASAIAERRLKPRPYLIDTVKHLISIGMGAIPGFQVSDDSEMALPTQCIENAYLNVYNLDYSPILIYPHILQNTLDETPVYYFMTFPTLAEGYPTQRGTPSFIMDLREIKNIIETPNKGINTKNRLPIIDILRQIHYNYFHPEPDRLREITPSSEITKDDPELNRYMQQYKNKPFPINAPFMCGCIRIRRLITHENNATLT